VTGRIGVRFCFLKKAKRRKEKGIRLLRLDVKNKVEA
jgi:hypothetical protein